jgi:hypothetical protein
MRKIEEEMLSAIEARKNWSKGNTSVRYFSGEENGNPFLHRAEIYLHGNHIATHYYIYRETEPNEKTFRKWPTTTTRSRLRALGINASTRKGVAYIGNEPA